jgi:hypothetical protein
MSSAASSTRCWTRGFNLAAIVREYSLLWLSGPGTSLFLGALAGVKRVEPGTRLSDAHEPRWGAARGLSARGPGGTRFCSAPLPKARALFARRYWVTAGRTGGYADRTRSSSHAQSVTAERPFARISTPPSVVLRCSQGESVSNTEAVDLRREVIPPRLSEDSLGASLLRPWITSHTEEGSTRNAGAMRVRPMQGRAWADDASAGVPPQKFVEAGEIPEHPKLGDAVALEAEERRA